MYAVCEQGVPKACGFCCEVAKRRYLLYDASGCPLESLHVTRDERAAKGPKPASHDEFVCMVEGLPAK